MLANYGKIWSLARIQNFIVTSFNPNITSYDIIAIVIDMHKESSNAYRFEYYIATDVQYITNRYIYVSKFCVIVLVFADLVT